MDLNNTIDWLTKNKIDEVECLVPDMAGIARGKILPKSKFINSVKNMSLRLPKSLFKQALTGEFAYSDYTYNLERDGDCTIKADLKTLRLVPWYTNPTAQVICDCVSLDKSEPIDVSPRYVLKSMLKLYDDLGYQVIIAPETEFYFIALNTNPTEELLPPVGMSGRSINGRQAFGIEAANEFDPVLEDIYDYADASNIDIDTLTHEVGQAQLEINFNHGEALELADQVFLFKRLVRKSALKHKIYATFMAKPHQNEPGSAMHFHISIIDKKTKKNAFSDPNGQPNDLMKQFIAGQQKFTSEAFVFFAPTVNSYRRIIADYASINLEWGFDNRKTGLRIPINDSRNLRCEHRLSGADVNPYLALSAILACGYLGIKEKLVPRPASNKTNFDFPEQLPTHLLSAINNFSNSKNISTLYSKNFVDLFTRVKKYEFDLYHRVISSWERENLLLNI